MKTASQAFSHQSESKSFMDDLEEDDVSVLESTAETSESTEDEVEQVRILSEKETSSINFWRYVVILVIICAGVAVSTGTFLYIRELERRDARDAVSNGTRVSRDLSMLQS